MPSPSDPAAFLEPFGLVHLPQLGGAVCRLGVAAHCASFALTLSRNKGPLRRTVSG